MKARIKKTGELVNIASYAKITLESCDSWGNPIEVSPEDVELINDTPSQDHWQDLRERAAIAAMQGLLTESGDAYLESVIAKEAIIYADALVKKLKGE